MNSRERFLNSIYGKPVDRFFRYEHGLWPSTRLLWLENGYADDQGFQLRWEMDPIQRIHINSGYTDSPFHPFFERHTLSETPTHITFADTDGLVKRVLRENPDTSMPQFIQYPMTSRADWAHVRMRLNPQDALARIGDITALQAACADETIPTLLPICGAFGHPRNLFGDENLSYVIYDDPALLDEILDNWCKLYIELITTLTQLVRVDSILIWEDMCYKGGPLISPRHFRRFMLPRYKALIQTCQACGIQGIMVDSDGDVLSLLPLWLEAGVNCVMPFEVQAGMDIVRIRRDFGPSFCIMGGINKRALAQDKAAIEREVERVLPFFRESGRFLPTLDHTVPTDVPMENFQYYLEVLRSYE